MDIGHAIRTVRSKLAIRQGALASRVGISQSSLSQIERGKREPGFALVGRIAEACRVPEQLLLLLAADLPEDKQRFREPLKDISMALLEMLACLERQ